MYCVDCPVRFCPSWWAPKGFMFEVDQCDGRFSFSLSEYTIRPTMVFFCQTVPTEMILILSSNNTRPNPFCNESVAKFSHIIFLKHASSQNMLLHIIVAEIIDHFLWWTSERQHDVLVQSFVHTCSALLELCLFGARKLRVCNLSKRKIPIFPKFISIC